MQKVTAAVIEKDGAVLIARRKKTDRFGGVWEFPGGKLEPGEIPEDGLRRELKEELGVETSVGPFLGGFPYVSAHFAIELLAFRVIILGGEIVLNDHDEIRWVRTADLGDFDFAKPDLPLVGLLLGRPFDQSQ
ncbi:MAG: (deoxy)nucleoside triphosphate pyrophosphohydrolase [Candidatus Aminicenantes bacterium]|nr:(deoxy)nucleoside triphosphate pyrophosphohydrolase [Candidatus Aminicenantes bacterium]